MNISIRMSTRYMPAERQGMVLLKLHGDGVDYG